eukprot:447163-Amphidinium_carterae.1
MDACPAAATAAMDSTGAATATTSTLAMFRAPLGVPSQDIVNVEVLENAVHVPTDLLLGRIILDDVKQIADAAAPFLDMTVGATPHLAGLVPAEWIIFGNAVSGYWLRLDGADRPASFRTASDITS